MKKKLSLNMEDLKVEAFTTSHDLEKRGTVHGHDDTNYPECTEVAGSCGGPYPGFCKLTYPIDSCEPYNSCTCIC
jgi:hypothetical protein